MIVDSTTYKKKFMIVPKQHTRRRCFAAFPDEFSGAGYGGRMGLGFQVSCL